MATVSKWTPFGVALDLTATGGTVTRTSATQFTVKIAASWETYYDGAQTNYGMTAASGGTTATISAFNGTKRSSGSGSFTGTYSISGNGSATKTITVTFRNFNTDNGDSATKTVSFSVSVPAWTSYTIKYNANGGSGAPGNQTKWKDQTLKLSTTKPTRTGHSFLGWSTSSTATSATYAAGANYTANSAATLYAVWKANTYSVVFNANGGTGAPATQTKTYGVTLTLSSTKPTRTGYNFLGWGTSASATAATYVAGGKYTANQAITLYAVWSLAYTRPTISGVSVTRCNSDGTAYDDSDVSSDETAGTYAHVVFSWKTTYPVEQISIQIPSGGVAGITYLEISENTTSGNVDEIIKLEVLTSGLEGSEEDENEKIRETSFTAYITVQDSGGSWSVSKPIPGLIFPIDVLRDGNGVAFGATAQTSGYADFGFKTRHRKNVEFENNIVIYGTTPDGTLKEIINPQNANGNFVIGYGGYDLQNGYTNVYGYDVQFGVSNIANPGTYRPYRRQGDSITITVRTAGYVTNSSKDVTFWVPFSVPIVGNPTVTVSSGTGFILRQDAKYTHGSSAETYIFPDSYAAARTMFNGVSITAVFSNITNVVNNAPIGVWWNGTITFT